MQSDECTRNCWIAAGVIGFLVWLFVSFIGETSVFGGLFLGLITAGLLGLFLVWALCEGSGSVADRREDVIGRSARSQARTAPATRFQSAAPASVAPAASGPAKSAAPAPATPPAPKPAAAASADPQQGSAKAGSDKRKPAAKAEKPASGAAGVTEAAKAKGTAAQSPASTAGEVSEKKAKPKAAPAAAEKKSKPAKAAKAVAPDDLKQIKGVGPKLEKLLHDNGVTSFAQIAAWADADIDRFAELIGSMGGRIRSDDWVQQAGTLASGGTTEFAQRVKKGDVY